MKKRTITLLLSLVLLVALLAACTPGASTATATGAPDSTSGKEEVVTVWLPGAEDEDETTDFGRVSAWAKDFNEANAGRIKVEVSGSHSPADILTVISAVL